MSPGTTHSKFLNVMFADIASYTRMTSMMDREHCEALHEVFDSIALPTFDKYGGRVIKKLGDAFLVVFESATDSLLCGIALQKGFEEYNINYKPSRPLRLKIGIAGGDVIIRNNDVYGDAVNLASRVEGAALPGEVFFTNSVFLAMNKNEVPFTYLGQKKFKGFRHSTKVFRVGGMALDRFKEKLRQKKFMRKLFWYFILLLIIMFLAIRFWGKLGF